MSLSKTTVYRLENLIKNVPENNIPEKNVDTTFSQPLQWILCQGQLAKNLNFFFENLHRLAKKSDKILQKKLVKNLF